MLSLFPLCGEYVINDKHSTRSAAFSCFIAYNPKCFSSVRLKVSCWTDTLLSGFVTTKGEHRTNGELVLYISTLHSSSGEGASGRAIRWERNRVWMANNYCSVKEKKKAHTGTKIENRTTSNCNINEENTVTAQQQPSSRFQRRSAVCVTVSGPLLSASL